MIVMLAFFAQSDSSKPTNTCIYGRPIGCRDGASGSGKSTLLGIMTEDPKALKGRKCPYTLLKESVNPFVSNQAQSDDKDFAYLSRWDNQIPTEWYNAFVLVLLGLSALAITRVMIWYGLR